MFERLGWIGDRFALPLLLAAWILYDHWGARNDIVILIVPIFILLFRMYISSLERPVCPLLEPYRPFQRALSRWNTCEVLGLFFLMLFETAVAVFAVKRALHAILIAFGWFFVPYTLLVLRARGRLLEARAMVAQSEKWSAESPSEFSSTDAASEPDADAYAG